MIRKSYLYILIAFILLFACCGRVDADDKGTVMYMECPNIRFMAETTPGDGNDSNDIIYDGYYKTVVNSSGNALFFDYSGQAFYTHYYDEGKNKEFTVIPIMAQAYSNCWIKKTSNTYLGCAPKGWFENAEIKSAVSGEGSCPVYIRRVKENDYFERDYPEYYNYISSEEYGSEDFWITDDSTLVLSGSTEPTNVSYIKEDEWIIYSYNYNGEKVLTIEGYLVDGRRFYLNLNSNLDMFFNDNFYTPFIENINKLETQYKTNIKGNLSSDDISRDLYLYKTVSLNKAGFWKVSERFNSLNVYVNNICKSKTGCDGFEIIASGGIVDYYDKIRNAFEDWGNIERTDSLANRFSGLKQYVNLIRDNDFEQMLNDFITSISENSVYYFDNNYNEHDFLNDLENIYSLLQLVESETKYESFYKNHWTGESTNFIMTDAKTYVINELFGQFKQNDDEEGTNNLILDSLGIKFFDYKNYFFDNIIDKEKYSSGPVGERLRDFEDMFAVILDNIADEYVDNFIGVDGLSDYLDNEEKFIHEIQIFTNAIAYFDYYSNGTDLSEDEKDRLSELNDKMQEFAKKYNIYPELMGCNDLIGEELEAKILSYFNIVRIIVPILLIGLGVFDFTKAIFAGDDSQMKKAQSKFIKRIFIAILFFFVPMIVKLLLEIASRVWVIISPDTCIKF